MKNCPCGGSNEYCDFCGGIGYIEEESLIFTSLNTKPSKKITAHTTKIKKSISISNREIINKFNKLTPIEKFELIKQNKNSNLKLFILLPHLDCNLLFKIVEDNLDIPIITNSFRLIKPLNKNIFSIILQIFLQAVYNEIDELNRFLSIQKSLLKSNTNIKIDVNKFDLNKLNLVETKRGLKLFNKQLNIYDRICSILDKYSITYLDGSYFFSTPSIKEISVSLMNLEKKLKIQLNNRLKPGKNIFK